MTKIDLITGFLGSGKTTFIKKYAKYLMKCGENIGILENDYGAVNVDMLLLQDLQGEQCELEMVAGGCDYDCHKRRFKTKLIAMSMCGYDRVLVEPSGIFDVDEFFDVLYEELLSSRYEIGNVIAVVNAKLETELSEQSEYLLASQTACAGRIVLSRSQEASEEEIADTIAHLNRAMVSVRCSRRFQSEIVLKDWETMTDADFADISACGYLSESYVKLVTGQEQRYTSLYFMNVHMPEQELRFRVSEMMKDASCGRVFRIKGFLMTENGSWIELNATSKEINIKPIAAGQEVLIVIGENLSEESVRSYLTTDLPFQESAFRISPSRDRGR